MIIKSLTTKIVGYDPATQHMQVIVKSDLCQRGILEYDPVNIDLSGAGFDVELALKNAATSAYYTIKARLVTESKTPEFFEQLAQQVDTMAQAEQVFTLGVDIPAPATGLVDESSQQGTDDTPAQVL